MKGRLTAFVWRTVGPYLQRQLTFNSFLVDHINRTVEAQKAAHRRDLARTEALRGHAASLAALHARLMQYLQQITAYVDTKDRDSAGGALVLNAALSDLAEAQGKYRESLAARESRYEARTAALSAAHEELRGMVGIAQQAIAALKRATEQHGPRTNTGHGTTRNNTEQHGPRNDTHQHGPRNDTGHGTTRNNTGQHGPRNNTEQHGPRNDTEPHGMRGTAAHDLRPPRVHPGDPALEGDNRPAAAFGGSLDAYKYVGFEDRFRGPEAAIRERQQSYVPYFERVEGSVLDIGCGRGEFIDLLQAHGIRARGIDLNHEMAQVCRERGLDVSEGDAVSYLADLPDASLGGIFAAQVVEHLEPSYLLRMLDLAFQKLQPGGVLVLETLNPACWTAFFESYIRDITHRWPLHPETLKYLVLASGFSRADVEFRSPVPPQDRLQPIAVPAGADEALRELAEAFNGNVEKLNARMFTFMDYAVVAQKALVAEA